MKMLKLKINPRYIRMLLLLVLYIFLVGMGLLKFRGVSIVLLICFVVGELRREYRKNSETGFAAYIVRKYNQHRALCFLAIIIVLALIIIGSIVFMIVNPGRII